jgi:hypothetical protein
MNRGFFPRHSGDSRNLGLLVFYQERGGKATIEKQAFA